MSIVACDVPTLSVLDRRLIEDAFFHDAYRAPLSGPQADVVEIFFAKEASGVNSSVVDSTVCTTHNAFGKVYLTLVIPFHRWGVQLLISRASAEGRLSMVVTAQVE